MNKLKTLVAKLPFGKSGFSWKLNLCILAAIMAVDGHLAYTQHRIRRDYAELVTADKRLNEAAKRLDQTTAESKQQFSRLQALRAKFLAENPCLVVPAHAIRSE